MRNIGLFLLSLLFFVIAIPNMMQADDKMILPLYPNDSILKRITDIDTRIKEFITKDTIGGFSSPRKIETSDYFRIQNTINDDRLRDREGLLVVPLDYQPFLSYMNFRDTMLIAPEMLPAVFEGKLLPNDIDFRSRLENKWNFSTHHLIDRDSLVSTDLYNFKHDEPEHYKLISKDSTFNSRLWKSSRTSFIRKEYYTNHPQRIKLNALAFDGSPIIKQEVEKRNPFKELITAGDAIAISRPEIEKYKVKQKFWKFWGEHKLDMAYKEYSDGWNPKTKNSFQIQSYHKFNAKYRKNKVEFNHELEWRFNAQSIPLSKEEKAEREENKTEKKYNPLVINDDWLRTYNKLGLDAFIKKWSYIVALEMKTPVFIKREQYDLDKRQAAFLSPLEVTFGIGAGYSFERVDKRVKDRRIKIIIDPTPLSVNLKHVGSSKVWRYGNKHGVVYDEKDKKGRTANDRRYTKTEIGLTINMTIDFKLNSFTSLYTRSKYFTNYHRAYLEVENTVKMQLNRYFAASYYIYMKYNDSVEKDNKDPKWKFFSYNQVLGFGLSYNW